ncbi:hypothetical protein BV25DRAFT_1920535 [Artomyces pyxidatus]|uniref:Uncharacterized protein n=1 Tax=Artomyces pyxidatus TaxID=48021 RepID=A0ACB8SM77_9AGAM|nr:hypothetical protein BV25DRAFT_1920535 [Artomyces pyxidatus]
MFPLNTRIQAYNDQMAITLRGTTSWYPPPYLPIPTSIGDVGFFFDTAFVRLFNIHLPANHPWQNKRVPEGFQPLPLPRIQRKTLPPTAHWSRNVRAERSGAEIDRTAPLANCTITFNLMGSDGIGGVQILPNGAESEDIDDIPNGFTSLTICGSTARSLDPLLSLSALRLRPAVHKSARRGYPISFTLLHSAVNPAVFTSETSQCDGPLEFHS